MTKVMKNLFKSILFIAAAAMTFSACNRTEIENPQNEEDFYYTFALTSPETRSILSSDENGKFGAWEDGDRLGTGIDEAKPGYAYVKVGTPATFRIYKQGGLAGGEIIYAYYPYSSSATSAAEIPMTIPSGQNQVGATFDFDAMPMVAEGFVVPSSYAGTEDKTEMGEISLVNLGSVIDFQVFSSNATYAEETILNVKFSASGAIAGEFTKDITAVKTNDESTLAISGFSGTEATTTVANATAIGATRSEAAHVYMVVAPASDITGSVIVTTNKAVYTYNMSSAQTFKRAGLKSFGLNLGTCQNREAEDTDATTFVFDTTAGIESLGIELPSTGNGTNVERAVSGFIVLTGDKGTNESYYPRVWNSNGTYNFRVNRNNTITLSITNGTIKGIAFDAGDKFNLTVEEGTLTGTNWEGSASSVTFTNNDNDRTDINKITVSYSGGVAPVDPIKLVMSDIICDNPEENETSLSFSWAAVENAEGYQVSLDGGNSYGDTQSAPSYVWNDLLAGTEYTIYVKAIGDGTNFITSEAKWQKGKTKDGEIIGVQWVETALANLSSSDVVVIVGNGYAMTNDNGTTSAPATAAVEVSGNKLVGDIADNIRWNVTVSDGNCTFYPNGVTNKWLYCNTTNATGSNNNMRVGTGDRKLFVLNSSNQLETNDSNAKRYLSIYNNADWRGYVNADLAPTIKFYKKVGNEPAPTTYTVNIATNIQNGTVNASSTTGIEAGESVTLTATPNDAANWEFESWDITGLTLTEAQKTTNPLTIQMPESDITVSASFKEKENSGGDDQTLTFTYSAHSGWTISSGAEDKGSYYLLKNESYIDSPSFSFTKIKSVKVTLRSFGGTQYGPINIMYGDTVIGSQNEATKNLTEYTINVTSPSAGSGSLRFIGQNTTEANGPGISEIVITYE